MKRLDKRRLNFIDFLCRKVEEPHGPTPSEEKTLLQATVHAFVASILSVVSTTNCYAIVNNLLNTAAN